MSAEARLSNLAWCCRSCPSRSPIIYPIDSQATSCSSPAKARGMRKGTALTGKLGAEINIDEGYRRARLVGLGLLAAMRDALGSLDRVDFIVKLLGMVNAVPNFNDSPKVINGCSDLFGRSVR